MRANLRRYNKEQEKIKLWKEENKARRKKLRKWNKLFKATVNCIVIAIMLIALYSLVFLSSAKADINPNLWSYIEERMFKDVKAVEVDFININAPKRANSGAQVPITIKLVETEGVYIEKIYLIIDANPTQHASTYYLTDKTQNLNLLTRIRMETDSYVRAVGEDTFQPKIGFKTRYGMVSNPFVGATPADGLASAGTNQYYRKFAVSNIL